ncbi:IS3 family transposase [Amycolatopsis sp. FDAARGOS 1241]|uniref:IS3 family transposase n=1 Tax=Amycolatopsis sp. FDAARGOS 1241 TaxID=2778070 RepID=UPI00351C32B5
MRHRGAYGRPRIVAVLHRRGRRVNHKRVGRVMREHGVVGLTRRRRRSLTRPDVVAASVPDLIGRDFTSPSPGRRLVGDITYLPTREGWLYLATVIDLYTPRNGRARDGRPHARRPRPRRPRPRRQTWPDQR